MKHKGDIAYDSVSNAIEPKYLSWYVHIRMDIVQMIESDAGKDMW